MEPAEWQAMSTQDFTPWIGRVVIRHDVVTMRLLQAFRAILLPHVFAQPDETMGLPGLHWCLAPVILEKHELAADGTERAGPFLPEFGPARRMWAGGEIRHYAPLGLHDEVTRNSTLSSVNQHEGSSGPLSIVSVAHEIKARGVLVVRERQDLVFRRIGSVLAAKPAAQRPVADLHWNVDADALLLFRFSALTFNGHRIHYDADYARQVEGQGGLLVHGPLQATLALNQAATLMGTVPKHFTYRCLAPLVASQNFEIDSRRMDDSVETTIFDAQGIKTFAAVSEA